MKNKLKFFVSIAIIGMLSGCATFDNLVKLPVENLTTTPEFETADFYGGKTLAITVYSPEGSFDRFNYGDRALTQYSKLFAKSMRAKRPMIGLISENELSAKMPNRDFVALSTRIARKTLADKADIEELVAASGADYVAIANIRGLSSRSDVVFDFPNTRIVEYMGAESTFTVYDAKTGNNIWYGKLDHETDDSWGGVGWQYMMERMYDGFVLRLPVPPKESKS